MRLAGREWRTLVSTARLGAERFRVIRPERAPGHAVLHDDLVGQQLSVDKTAAIELAIAWWLAAHSSRSLVWLPLRSSPASCGSDPGARRLDLVLLHHSLHFPASRWKDVRSRLAEPKVQKVTMPPGALPDPDRRDHDRRWHREFRDELRWTVAADTLFVVGSRLGFELEGWKLRRLAEEGPAGLATRPDAHVCAEIELGRRHWRHWRYRRGGYSEFHVECCNRHW